MTKPAKKDLSQAEMESGASLKDQLIDCTVRLECAKENGSKSSGTAFLFRFDVSPGRIVEALVTNKHVVKDATLGKFCLTHCDAAGKPQIGKHTWFGVPDFAQSWILHPDAEVDLCVMPFHAIREAASKGGQKVFLLGIGEDALPTKDDLTKLGAICDVFMIGYPNALWDSANNRPIVRRGISATDPRLSYQSKREFLIDAACFPGSSGSPVFGFYEDTVTSVNKILQGEHIHLLGVLHAGPQHTAKAIIDGLQTEGEAPWTAKVKIPNNLGMVISSSCLADFKPLLKPTRHFNPSEKV